MPDAFYGLGRIDLTRLIVTEGRLLKPHQLDWDCLELHQACAGGTGNVDCP